MNKSFVEKNDNNLNNKINDSYKTQTALKNKNLSSISQENEFSDNYYYNLMVNEDMNRINSGLKKKPKTYHGNLKNNN